MSKISKQKALKVQKVRTFLTILISFLVALAAGVRRGGCGRRNGRERTRCRRVAVLLSLLPLLLPAQHTPGFYYIRNDKNNTYYLNQAPNNYNNSAATP